MIYIFWKKKLSLDHLKRKIHFFITWFFYVKKNFYYLVILYKKIFIHWFRILNTKFIFSLFGHLVHFSFFNYLAILCQKSLLPLFGFLYQKFIFPSFCPKKIFYGLAILYTNVLILSFGHLVQKIFSFIIYLAFLYKKYFVLSFGYFV